MRLRLVTPREVRLDLATHRIVAEGPDGSFGMLPRHIDFVSQLVPGILVYEIADGVESYAGIDAGTRLCCANPCRDSSRESSMVAGRHEQTHTPDLQDQELAGLQ